MFGALIYILIFQSARPQSCRLAAFREHSAPLKAARAVARDTNVVVTIRLKTGCSRDKKNEGTVQRCAPCRSILESDKPSCLVNLRRVPQLSRQNAHHICEIAGLRDVSCMGRKYIVLFNA